MSYRIFAGLGIYVKLKYKEVYSGKLDMVNYFQDSGEYLESQNIFYSTINARSFFLLPFYLFVPYCMKMSIGMVGLVGHTNLISTTISKYLNVVFYSLCNIT